MDENGHKNGETLPIKLANGPQWDMPVTLMRDYIQDLWQTSVAARRAFLGAQLQATLSGEKL